MTEKQKPRIRTPKKRKESEFDRQLKRGGEQIFKAAEGRTCGGCVFYTGSSCQVHLSSVTGSTLEIHNPKAPACSDWESHPSADS
jgi:hypothetical protein